MGALLLAGRIDDPVLRAVVIDNNQQILDKDSKTMRSIPSPYPHLAKKATRQLDHIPGDYGLPLIGYTREFFTDLPGLIDRKAAQYGPVHKSATVFQRGINLLGPEANQFILNDKERNFSSKSAWDVILDRLFPNGLMLRDFDDHRFHRRILQDAFKKPVLAQYADRMNAVVSDGIERWPRLDQSPEPFCFFKSIKTLLLETATEVFLGEELNQDSARVNQSFVDLVDSSLAVVRLPIPGTPWYRGMQGRAYLEEFFSGKIAARRQLQSADFFSRFCQAKDEEGNQLSDEQIVDHMIFLLFAAHDTITSTLSSIVYLLAINPEWQQRLQQEFKMFDCDKVGFDELAAMEQTGWVFKEALRMHPPLPLIPRRAIRECEFQGFVIPENAGVAIHPRHTHYMESLWTAPQRFDPERWSPERNESKKHFFQFVPFGGGAHKCLGLNFAEIQAKVFLFQLLSRYRVHLKPGHVMRYDVVPLAMPKNGLPITLEKL